MFSLSEKSSKLAHINVRRELHGEDPKTAVDLKIEFTAPNDILSEFHPSLKSAFYKAAEGNQPQLITDENHLPTARFPLLAPLHWDWEAAGYAVTIHYGVSGKDDIFLPASALDKFRLHCQDGGSVAVSFRVVCHPEPEQIGRLSSLIQQEISLTLEPPSADQQLKNDLKKAA